MKPTLFVTSCLTTQEYITNGSGTHARACAHARMCVHACMVKAIYSLYSQEREGERERERDRQTSIDR